MHSHVVNTQVLLPNLFVLLPPDISHELFMSPTRQFSSPSAPSQLEPIFAPASCSRVQTLKPFCSSCCPFPRYRLRRSRLRPFESPFIASFTKYMYQTTVGIVPIRKHDHRTTGISGASDSLLRWVITGLFEATLCRAGAYFIKSLFDDYPDVQLEERRNPTLAFTRSKST